MIHKEKSVLSGRHILVVEDEPTIRRFYERLGATNRGGEVFVPPGGGRISSRRYAWTTLKEVAQIANE